jgi:hypothetical protein
VLFTATALGAAPAGTTDEAAKYGAEEIMLDGGSKGAVFFPHRRHQEADSISCTTCHELFPQEPGSIVRLKDEGTLKARQVMNSQCIGCHRKNAAAGKASGPRSCNKCHE